MKLWEIQAHEKQFLTPSESRQAHELVTTKNFSYMRDAQPRRENIPTPPSLFLTLLLLLFFLPTPQSDEQTPSKGPSRG